MVSLLKAPNVFKTSANWIGNESMEEILNNAYRLFIVTDYGNEYVDFFDGTVLLVQSNSTDIQCDIYGTTDDGWTYVGTMSPEGLEPVTIHTAVRTVLTDSINSALDNCTVTPFYETALNTAEICNQEDRDNILNFLNTPHESMVV